MDIKERRENQLRYTKMAWRSEKEWWRKHEFIFIHCPLLAAIRYHKSILAAVLTWVLRSLSLVKKSAWSFFIPPSTRGTIEITSSVGDTIACVCRNTALQQACNLSTCPELQRPKMLRCAGCCKMYSNTHPHRIILFTQGLACLMHRSFHNWKVISLVTNA